MDLNIKENKDLAAIQAELDAEREKLIEERRQFEAKRKEEAYSADKVKEAADAATEAAEKASKAAAKVGRNKSFGGFLRGLVIGLIIGAIACFFIGRAYIANKYGIHNIAELGNDNVVEEHATGYTAIDFKEAILGEAEGHQELIVMEQPIQFTETLHREGPWEWEVFRRTKNITYYGTGVYTVNLSKLNQGSISVDEASKMVKLTIPHAALQYINPDFEKIEFEDTEKGLLAFTDITLTAEEHATIEESVVEGMRELLSAPEVMSSADEFATMKVWDTFQPLVSAISPEYRLEILFR